MPDRIIKESICISETLNELTDFEERFWHRLTVNCDDYGRFDARPAVLKGRLFPLMESKTHKDMANALNKLASVGLVELYKVDGRPFLHVVTWEKHQRIRAKKSKFPSPADICRQVPSNVPVIQSNPIQSNPKEDEDNSAHDPELGKAISYYMDKIGGFPGGLAKEELPEYVQTMSADVVIRAIDETIARDVSPSNWKYVSTILRGWKQSGVKTIADAKREIAKFEESKQRKQMPSMGNSKKSFSEIIAERAGKADAT